MSVLKEICDYKLNKIKQLKNNFSENFLLDRIKEQENPRGFAKALTKTLKKNQFALSCITFINELPDGLFKSLMHKELSQLIQKIC